MAATPATLTVNFVANYAGPHRVCYRIGGSGPYTCITVNCTGGGAQCSQDISVMVDNETCDVINFNGYAQAACLDINSTTDRIPFSYDFTPNPSCKRYIVTCANVGLESITVTGGGSGYDPISPPSVIISGGGGSGATATAVVSGGGVVTGITLNTPGTGYTSIPSVIVGPPGGAGSPATAVAVLDSCGTLTAPACSGSAGTIPAIIELGGSVSICSPTAPTIPSDFTSVENGNCTCNCVEMTLTVSGAPGATIEYFYNRCSGDFVTGFMSVGSSPGSIEDCIVSGSLITTNISGSPTPNIVYGSACTS